MFLSHFFKTLRIQVSPKEGISPIILWPGDGIGTRKILFDPGGGPGFLGRLNWFLFLGGRFLPSPLVPAPTKNYHEKCCPTLRESAMGPSKKEGFLFDELFFPGVLFWISSPHHQWLEIPCFLLGCPWKLVTIVSKLGYFTYLGDVSNLLIYGVYNPVTKYRQDIPT